MSTIKYPFQVQKYVRRVVTREGAVAVTGALSQEAASEIERAPWRRVVPAAVFADMPRHNALALHVSDSYDAYQQCGAYAAGRQRVYAGQALYRVTLPTDGAAKALASIAVQVAVSRYTEEGAGVVAWRTSAATPEAAYAESPFPETVVAADVGKPSTYPAAAHSTATVDLTWTVAPTTGDYLWIAVTLQEYGGARGFWVEGAAALSIATLALTYGVAVTADASPLDDETPALPIRIVDATRYDFSATSDNLDDFVLQVDWAAKMLSGGQVGESVTPDGYPWDAACFGPRASAAAGVAQASGYIATLYCPGGTEGQTLRLRMAGVPTADIRLAIHTGADAPDAALASTWRAGGVATAVVSAGATNGSVVDVALSGAIVGRRLHVAVSLLECPPDAVAAVGSVPGHGINLFDAHIGVRRFDATAVAPEWVGYDGERTGGLLLPRLTGATAAKSVLDRTTAAAVVGTDLVTSGAVVWVGQQPIQAATVDAWESTTTDGQVTLAVVDSLGVLRIGRIGGGTIQAALQALDGEAATQAVVLRVADLTEANNAIAILKSDGTVLQAKNPAWTNAGTFAAIASLSATRDGGLLVGVTTAGAVITSSMTEYAGIATTLETWTGISKVVITSTHAVGLKTDGTVLVVAFPSLSPFASLSTALTWTGVSDVAAVPNAVVGVLSDESVVVDGLATWIDTADLPGMQSAIGSWWRRLALRLA